MKRLLLDHWKRLWIQHLSCITMSWVIWSSVLSGNWQASWGLALSLILINAEGPLQVELHRGLREVALLPVSRRQVWQARWVMGIVFPVACSVIGKVLVLISAASLTAPPANRPALAPGDMELIGFSVLYDLAYVCGATGLSMLLGQARSRRLERGADLFAFTTSSVGWMILPFLLRPWLPVRFADAGPVSLAFLTLAVATGLMSWFSSAAEYPVFLRRARPTRPQAGAQRPVAARRQYVSIDATLSLLRIAALKCLGAGVMFGLLASCGFVVAFEGGSSPFPGHVAWKPWLLLAVVTGSGDWRTQVRQLRRLPISTGAVNLLVLGTSWMIGIFAWAIVVPAFRFCFPSQLPGGLTAPVALTMIGVGMVFEAARLRWRWYWQLVTIVGLMYLLAPGLRALAGAPDSTVLLTTAAFALVCTTAAGLLNRHTFLTSNRLYKRPPAEAPFPFGLVLPR